MKRRPGRIAAGLLVACSLLVLPASPRAQEADAGPDSEAVNAEIERLRERVEELEQSRISHDAARTEREELERRIEELESAKVAHEEATRSILRDTLSTLGSQINEFVVFGGTLEFVVGWGQSFDGTSDAEIRLNTAELDFEIQPTDWVLGSIIFEYDDGADTLFPTTEGFEISVDRINIDTAFVTLGDTQRFPPFVTLGRLIVPFGISTGDPVADVLTLEDPLTVEVFETKADAILVGVEFPTPSQGPETPILTPEPVRPQVLAPFVGWLSRQAGYSPPPPPPPEPSYTIPISRPPPFSAGVYFYNGNTFDDTAADEPKGWQPGDQFGATVSYRSRLDCTPYGQRRLEDEVWWDWITFFCPSAIEYDVDFNRSVFESLFLINDYQRFLNEIGFVPGMAGSVKASLGPVGLVVEWNGAIEYATFEDDADRQIRIRPDAWQVSLGYQLDWQPWVEAIGAQGTYLAFSYSQSADLAGVIQEGPVLVGTVPRRRILVGAGEWILDGVRVAVEYAHIEDYPISQGGTGRDADGFFSMLTLEW